MADLKDLRKEKKEDLTAFLKENNEPTFRAKQILEWIWKKSCTNIDEMSNLSLSLREKLKSHYKINAITIHQKQISTDGTIKCAFKLHDGNLIEGVLIPTENRMTACISSQVGCSLTCKFCATGYMERKRNLDAAEMYDQVVLLKQLAEEHYQIPLTNIVYMGMGEPLLNYQNVLESTNLITSPDGLNMSPKRITLSTAGVAKMIKKLADDKVKFNLALSLHAADDIKRDQIMPINETNSIDALYEALKYFHDNTQNKITFEYIVFKDFNDDIEDAQNLLKLCKNIYPKINIIEYNPISEAKFKNADINKLEQFKQFLEQKKIIVNIRKSRGKDIDAACGQLANKSK